MKAVMNLGVSATAPSGRLGRVGSNSIAACRKPSTISTREMALTVRCQGVPTNIERSPTQPSASTMPPAIRLTSNIVPFVGESDTTYGVNLMAHLASTATVEDIVQFAAELNGHVVEGKRRRFQGVCNKITFSFGSEKCVWNPEEREIPELVKQHFKDRAMDCGVKSLTLVMHSDSDVHSVRCLCGSLISRIQTERNPRKVLSRHV